MVLRFNRQIGVQRNYVFALSTRNSAYENGGGSGGKGGVCLSSSFTIEALPNTNVLYHTKFALVKSEFTIERE